MSCKNYNSNSNHNKNNNQNNKHKIEDTSFQEKLSIDLNDLIGFSKFFIKIHEFSCCDLDVCEIGEFVDKFDFF